MTNRRWREICAEGLRETLSIVLAVILLLPALVIRLVDRWMLRRIRKRGGLD